MGDPTELIPAMTMIRSTGSPATRLNVE
jgi:hypothetical protein